MNDGLTLIEAIYYCIIGIVAAIALAKASNGIGGGKDDRR